MYVRLVKVTIFIMYFQAYPSTWWQSHEEYKFRKYWEEIMQDSRFWVLNGIRSYV